MNVLCRYLVCLLINVLMLYSSVVIADPLRLDLAELESRLRTTDAIGLFTKLSLKRHVDELIDEFRAFHEGSSGEIEFLRQHYEQLLSDTLALLENGDPDLRQDISRSRAALWTMLADPVQFADL